MADENEMVVIEMWPDDRRKLYGHITSQMDHLGYNPCDYGSLNLGIELPADWPHAENAQPTLAQLIIVARKLEMKIIIHHLELEPRKVQKPPEKSEYGSGANEGL